MRANGRWGRTWPWAKAKRPRRTRSTGRFYAPLWPIAAVWQFSTDQSEWSSENKTKTVRWFFTRSYATGQIEAITGGFMCVRRLLSAFRLTPIEVEKKIEKIRISEVARLISIKKINVAWIYKLWFLKFPIEGLLICNGVTDILDYWLHCEQFKLSNLKLKLKFFSCSQVYVLSNTTLPFHCFDGCLCRTVSMTLDRARYKYIVALNLLVSNIRQDHWIKNM